MNLIEELGIEKCREIVEGAPSGAHLFFHFGEQFENRVDYYKYFFNHFQMWLPDHGWFPIHEDLAEDALNLENLRTAIAEYDQHWYGQSEEKELNQYAILSQEKIEGGAALVGDFTAIHEQLQNELNDCSARDSYEISITDTCSDIKNHITPLTGVIER